MIKSLIKSLPSYVRLLIILNILLAFWLFWSLIQITSLRQLALSTKSSVGVINKFQNTSVCDEVVRQKVEYTAKIYSGKLALVDFSSIPEAKTFRTAIAEQASKGPNFAGHYVVTTWGCGTECQGWAIVDSITGKIIDYQPYYSQVSKGLSYSIDSDIMVLNPKLAKNYLGSRSIEEVVKDEYEAHKARVYYQLTTDYSGKAWLNTICTENILDGQS